jgi:hypothetical protein
VDEHLKGNKIVIVKPTEDVGSLASDSEDIKWKIVDTMIRDYTKVHPKEMLDLIKENKAIKESIENEFARSKGGGLRWGFRLPPGLLRIIERRFPDIFTDKQQITKFMKQYPALRVCEIV